MWKLPNIQILPGESFAKFHFIDAVRRGPQSQDIGDFPQQTAIIYCENTHTHTHREQD